MLISKHDATPEQAKELAACWGFGRGYDLRNSYLRQFNELFGKNVGPYLYQSVYEQRMQEWETTSSGYYCYCTLIQKNRQP